MKIHLTIPAILIAFGVAACGGAYGTSDPVPDETTSDALRTGGTPSAPGGGGTTANPGGGGGGGGSPPSGGGGGGSPPSGGGGDGTVTSPPSGGAGFELCDPNKCPAQLPAIARLCPDGAVGTPECIKYPGKACSWEFFCAL